MRPVTVRRAVMFPHPPSTQTKDVNLEKITVTATKGGGRKQSPRMSRDRGCHHRLRNRKNWRRESQGSLGKNARLTRIRPFPTASSASKVRCPSVAIGASGTLILITVSGRGRGQKSLRTDRIPAAMNERIEIIKGPCPALRGRRPQAASSLPTPAAQEETEGAWPRAAAAPCRVRRNVNRTRLCRENTTVWDTAFIPAHVHESHIVKRKLPTRRSRHERFVSPPRIPTQSPPTRGQLHVDVTTGKRPKQRHLENPPPSHFELASATTLGVDFSYSTRTRWQLSPVIFPQVFPSPASGSLLSTRLRHSQDENWRRRPLADLSQTHR